MTDFLQTVKAATEQYIYNELDKQGYTPFKKNNLPQTKGIYFIYTKKQKDLVYIGCAHADGRTIRKRCGQYLETSDKGASFRDKVTKRELKLEKNDKNIEITIKYISDNYVLKFVEMDSTTTSSEIQLIERACITLMNPIYND